MHDWDNPLADVEAIVRSAGQYVRASDDLRPRVLEAARMQSGEQRAQRRIRHVSVVVLLLACLHIAEWQGLHGPLLRSHGMLMAAGFRETFTPIPTASTRSGDGDWRVLDAFTELRRQQAQLLRFEM
jgi:hypothetical protein